MMEMTRVKFLIGTVYLGGVWFIGDVVKVDVETAKQWIADGTAEEAHTLTSPPAPLPKERGEKKSDG